MAILKRPKRANDSARPKLSFVAASVAAVLSQSKVVAEAFGRTAGFFLMMTALFVVLSASVSTVIVIEKGAGIALGSLAKLWL
jgi:hypothetical protein